MKKLLSLVLVAIFALSACSGNSGFETITIDQIPQKVEEGYHVLDVREPSEFNTGHIPGSTNKPLTDLKKGNFEGLDQNQKYIVICQSGNRSKQASGILAGKDYDVLNVSEGMSSWTGEME